MDTTNGKVNIIARTAPISATAVLLSRLGADGAEQELRLQACLESSAEGSRWRMHRYAYRLTGGPVRSANCVRIELVSQGRVVHAFVSPDNVVNDGRWYIHEHTTHVPKAALTYARFEAFAELAQPRLVPVLSV